MTSRTPNPTPACRRRPRGFTLIESMLVIVIVGVGVLAMVAAQQAFHVKNAWAQRAGTGFLLAGNVRESMLGLPAHDPETYRSTFGPEESHLADFDDVDDFDAFDSDSFGGVINGARQNVPDMAGWRQQVEVVNVLPSFLSATDGMPDFSTDMLRVTVTVSFTGETIAQLTWVIPDNRAPVN